jgi:pyruvate-formate lyase
MAQKHLTMIQNLHECKLRYNEEKLQRVGGSYDFDDHGWVPLDLEREVEPVRDPESGLVTGMEAVTGTFARYLDANPPYVHPDDAFAGCWVGNVSYMGDPWRDSERFWENERQLPLYNITTRGLYAMNHCAPDLQIGLDLGWGGLLRKIETFESRRGEAYREFYEGEKRLVLAIQRYVQRNADAAAQRAEQETDPELRQHFSVIAEICSYLVSGAPRTLREALQWIVFWQDVDRMYFNGGAGQELDTLLQPYYEADVRNGVITDDEEVVWYFASLFFNDPHYWMIGGQDPMTGKDASSKLSFLILEGQHRLAIPTNLALRVSESVNDALLTRAIQYLFADGTGVSYSCGTGLDRGYMRNGRPASIARMRAKVGCNWTALPGFEYCLQDVTRICLAKPLLLALDDMLASEEENSMENLLKRYEGHLERAIQLIKDGIDWHVKYKWRNKPEVVLNLVCHGPIERGIDMSCGGVDILNFACDATALATTANSLAAIEQRVVKEKRLTWEQLVTVLKNDYAGAEDIRLMLKSVPQYGAGGTRADFYAKYLSELYTDRMRSTPTKDGYIVLPGIFSHGDVYLHGKNLGATPNGRHAGDAISHSADPDPGFLPNGGTAPTAKANAVARVQSGWGNSTPLQIDLDAQLAREMGGIENIKAYIKTHDQMGGTLININVVSTEKLLAAHKNPDLYPDLVVRVTGYSAFFKSLSPEYRQQVVDRWLANG